MNFGNAAGAPINQGDLQHASHGNDQGNDEQAGEANRIDFHDKHKLLRSAIKANVNTDMLKQSGWTGFPSGLEKVVMELAVPRSEIESRYGLVFIPGEDSLGPGYSTYFIDDLLGPVTILYYDRTTHGRAYVFVDFNVNYKVAVPRLLEVFGLDPSLVCTPDNLDDADAQHELSPILPYLNKKI